MGRPCKDGIATPEGPTYLEPTFSGIVPKCTDLESFKFWLNDQGASQSARSNFCQDCTPEFQAQRKKQGRCENPEVRFRKDLDGMWQGVIYRVPRGREARKRLKGAKN